MDDERLGLRRSDAEKEGRNQPEQQPNQAQAHR
jgi:hypothetical protein